MSLMFRDRKDAGERLAAELGHYRDMENVLVLGLPRGGVVVAAQVARALRCPLDVLIVKKLGFPTNAELAVGAISETGALVFNEDLIAVYGVSREYLDREVDRKQEEIERRVSLYRGGRSCPELAGKTIILVDDGVATGATVKAAIASLRQDRVGRLVVAMPVAAPDTERELSAMSDEWVCLQAPPGFMAVGGYYRDFDQVEDEEVVEILREFAPPQE